MGSSHSYEDVKVPNPLLNMTIEGIFKSLRYPFEKHEIMTTDGYFLTAYRLPAKKNEYDYKNSNIKRQPIIFQHGLLDSCDCWIVNAEERCFPFIFANLGYDVWLTNSRGNKYCKKHKVYNIKSFEFWQFSLHDLGLYDLPCYLEYIKKTNNSGEKMIYVGHSQGTSMLFSALSINNDYYKNLIKLFLALAPVARLNKMTSKLLGCIQNLNLPTFCNGINLYEMFPSANEGGDFLKFINKNLNPTNNFSINLISDSMSEKANDPEALKNYKIRFPSGTSLKCLTHFSQIIELKQFTYFDYGKEANMFIYKRVFPPEYEIEKINGMKIMLLVGQEDRLADPADCEWLYEKIKSNVILYKVIPTIGHVSFLVGKSIDWFDDVLKIINNEYNLKEPV